MRKTVTRRENSVQLLRAVDAKPGSGTKNIEQAFRLKSPLNQNVRVRERLKALIEYGYISDGRSQSDKRVRAFRLTPKGKAALNRYQN